MVEKQIITKRCSYSSKSDAFVVLSDSEVTFFDDDAAFCPFLYCVLFIALNYRRWMPSSFLVFHTSGSISSRPAAFLLFIFVITTLSSSSVIKSLIGLSMTFEGFPSRSLKCSLHFCILPFWLAAFNFGHKVLFLLLTSFTVCHVNHDCLSSTEFSFYWFGFEFILVLFVMCLVSLGL